MPFREDQAQYFSALNAIKIPRATRAIAVMLILGTIIVGCFLYYVPWIQTTSGFGTVTALNPNDRLHEINALVSGRIQEWYVRDGSPIKKGDPVIKIVDNDPLLLDRLNAEKLQITAKFDAAKNAEKTAGLDLKRTQELFEKGLASRRELEQAKIRVEQLRSSTAEAAAELNRIDVSLSRQSAQIVTAPRDGIILRVNSGDSSTFVSAGDPIATFIPKDVERAIEMFINGRDIALVNPGNKVRIQFEGWPAVQFSGWPSVAVGTFGGEVIAVEPSADAQGRFRVLVVEDKSDPHPWPESQFIRFGAKVHGWILLGQVSVGYELWRQLNSFPPDFTATSEPTTNQANVY